MHAWGISLIGLAKLDAYANEFEIVVDAVSGLALQNHIFSCCSQWEKNISEKGHCKERKYNGGVVKAELKVKKWGVIKIMRSRIRTIRWTLLGTQSNISNAHKLTLTNSGPHQSGHFHVRFEVFVDLEMMFDPGRLAW